MVILRVGQVEVDEIGVIKDAFKSAKKLKKESSFNVNPSKRR